MNEKNNTNNIKPENTKQLPPQYNPHGLEDKWYKIWEQGNYFSWKYRLSKDDKQVSQEQAKQYAQQHGTFSIVIPPPNVTGSLHLGHALNHTIQDILTRYWRMKGRLSLWLPGTDHAGIATQNVVERLLAKEGKARWDFSREQFEERVWQWKAESGGMITHQQRQLGESVDWDYERFTFDEGLSKVVKKVFVQLYKEGLIYRSERIINWCPHDVTALSNIEVEYKEQNGKLYYFKYPLVGQDNEFVVIATTRPETMLGDEAVAIHPDDAKSDGRYHHLRGKKLLLPLTNREIPIIEDDFVEKDFGTGAVKITPAHDPNDFLAGKRHNLPITRVMDDHGKMNELAGAYKGMSREAARKKIVEDLETLDLVVRVENMKHAVGHCYRCSTVVEPISSLQWFVDTKTLAKKAIEVVENGEIKFVPKRWENTYFEWMHNIQDWCISRQLWWGHRIPAYYCQDCSHVMVSEEDVTVCEKCGSKHIKQDEDVLDTWFSSGLWPFSTMMNTDDKTDEEIVFPASSPELDLFYPTSVLVTGFDIIFFWVARMIMFGTHFQKNIPFETVYIHGLVRDATRQKMSKSKGNVVNPLEKMDEYGTDAFRFFLMSILPEGKDIIFDESRLKGYQSFCNKVWNTARFIWMNQPADYVLPKEAPQDFSIFDKWILQEYNLVVEKTGEAIEHYRFAEYAQLVYDFIWKSFCDNYIEFSKISLQYEKTSSQTRYVLNYVFLGAMKLLHPVMPYITEELYSFWQENEQKNNQEKELILVSDWAKQFPLEDYAGKEIVDQLLHVIYKIRNLRAEFNLPAGEKFSASIANVSKEMVEKLSPYTSYITRLARLSELNFDEKKTDGIKTPLNFGVLYLQAGDYIDIEKEKTRLLKEKKSLEKALASLNNTLANEEFVKKAPAQLVAAEKQKAEKYNKKIAELDELFLSLEK